MYGTFYYVVHLMNGLHFDLMYTFSFCSYFVDNQCYIFK